MVSAFHGTIYEPYDFFADCSHVTVIHANPSVTDSAALAGERLSQKQMRDLSDQTAGVIRACLPENVVFQTLPVEGFLIFALGFSLPDAPPESREDALLEQLSCWLENAVTRIRDSLQLVLQLSVSSLHRNTQNVYDAYHEAFSIAVHFPFFQHSGQIVFFREFQNGLSAAEIEEKKHLEKHWLALMEAQNYPDAEAVLLHILELRASAPVTVTSLTQELISRMEFSAYQLCDAMELPLGIQDHLLRQIQQIHSVKTMDALRQQAHEIYAVMSSIAAGSSHGKDLSWSRKISAFIQNNYADPNLSAAMISRRFGLAPAYISHIFHQSTGMKLLDYIHTTRIEHIKRLLLGTSMRLDDIAKRTGYIDRYSMSRVFRRYVGMTPSDYRRNKHQEA